MTGIECVSCRRPRASLRCGLCGRALCKTCDLELDPKMLRFLKSKPPDLSHGHYCPTCHDEKVSPALVSHEEVLEQAKKVFVFFTTQRKAIPLIRRSQDRVTVRESPDRDDTILQLAFFAAELGFNALVETDVVGEKERSNGFQTMKWRGTAYPAQVDEGKIERDEARIKR